MLECPLHNQPQHTRRKLSSNDNKRMNINQGFVLTILGVKMRREMIFKVHLDNDAEESADLSLAFAPSPKQ